MPTVLCLLRQPRRAAGIWWSLCAAFAIRALVPVGFMPAPLGAGGPFALCHGQSAATYALVANVAAVRDERRAPADSHSPSHAHAPPHGQPPSQRQSQWHDHRPGLGPLPADSPPSLAAGGTQPAAPADPEAEHDERWAHCPLGNGASDLALAPAVEPGLAPAPAPLARQLPVVQPARRHLKRYLARAPPA